MICDVAWTLRMSEQQFYDTYEKLEREQLIATYQSRLNRDYVMMQFPIKR